MTDISIYLFPAGLTVLMLAAAISVSSKFRKFPFILAIISLLTILISSLHTILIGIYPSIFGYLVLSPFSAFFLVLFSTSMILIEVLCYGYSKAYPEISFMIALSFIAMFVIATAQSFLPILLGLELITISSSFMILFHGKHRVEAAVKLFITGSLAIGIFTFAIALIFPQSSSLALSPIALIMGPSGKMVILALALFITALGFEGAMFPFNLWMPDVYQGAPTFVTAMLAGINKKVGFLVLIQVLFSVFILYAKIFSPILQVLAICTMFFGNLLALNEKSLKRILAYSSISQAGYILVGLAAATPTGLTAALFYLFSHSFMIIGAFAIVLFLESNNIKTVEDCTALYSRNGFTAIALTIFMLSMAGIPPLMGFFGKLLLFSSAIYAHMVILAVIGIINSFISIYYYGRVINAMFQRRKERVLLLDPYVTAVVIISLAVIIIFGLYPQPIISLASLASSYLIH